MNVSRPVVLCMVDSSDTTYGCDVTNKYSASISALKVELLVQFV